MDSIYRQASLCIITSPYQTNKKRLVLTQAAHKVGLPIQAVEKDLWVTAVLQIVFSSKFARNLIFKGGTSLSKVWGVINRFSEDIDLAIDPHIWGYGEDLTKKQIKRLRKESSLFVQHELYQSLADTTCELGLGDYFIIKPEPNGEGDNTYPEPRTIHFKYTSIVDNTLIYLQPEVKLEVGARSLLEPCAMAEVTSIVEQSLPISTTIAKVAIPTAVPEKTFIEKLFILHELFSVQINRSVARKSRHIYDIFQMAKTQIAKRAISDHNLWDTIRVHRNIFTGMNGVDYSENLRQRICLIPPHSMIDDWKKDYDQMRTAMIYGDKPSFEEMLDCLDQLQSLLRQE